jgi:hypothetical protein
MNSTQHLRPLLSANEKRAARVLEEACASHGWKVFAQVKLSHVLSPNVAGNNSRLRDYATRAEFDFVICDSRTLVPEFAIELDDLSHERPEVIERDRRKNQLCALADFELLRIGVSALDRGPRRLRLVEYLLEARSYCKAFDAAQEGGGIPLDADCDVRWIVERRPDGTLDRPYDLALPARSEAMRAHQRGEVTDMIINCLAFYWRNGVVEGWAWLRVHDDCFLFERATIRSWQFRCGISPGEIAEDLATAMIGGDLPRLRSNDAVLMRAGQIEDLVQTTRSRRHHLESTHVIDHLSFRSSSRAEPQQHDGNEHLPSNPTKGA